MYLLWLQQFSHSGRIESWDMNLLPCFTVCQAAFMHRFNDIYSSWSTIRETNLPARVVGIIKSYLRLKSQRPFCNLFTGRRMGERGHGWGERRYVISLAALVGGCWSLVTGGKFCKEEEDIMFVRGIPDWNTWFARLSESVAEDTLYTLIDEQEILTKEPLNFPFKWMKWENYTCYMSGEVSEKYSHDERFKRHQSLVGTYLFPHLFIKYLHFRCPQYYRRKIPRNLWSDSIWIYR